MSIESATTESFPLPGLEALGLSERREVSSGHWLDRSPSKRLMVFSGSSHPGLAAAIAEKLGVELGEIVLETFPTARRTAATASRSAALTSSSSRPAAHRSTGT